MQNSITQQRQTNYLIFCLCILGFAVIGFIPNSAIDVRCSKRIVAELGIILFFSLFFVRNIWLKLFLVWAVIRSVIGIYEMDSMSASIRVSHYYLSRVFLFVIFSYVIGFQLLVNNIRRDHYNLIFNWICILALIQSFIVILQWFGIWIALSPKCGLTIKHIYLNGWIVIADMSQFTGKMKDAMTGLMSNVNMTSSMIALSVPAFFRKKWCYLLPIILIGLLLAQSLGGLVPIFIISVGIMLTNKKTRPYAAILCVLAIAYMYFSGEYHNLINGSGRFVAYKAALKYIVSVKPIIGAGGGQFKVIFKSAMQSLINHNVIQNCSYKFKYMHNEYLEYLVEYGIIGLSIIGCFLVNMFFKIRNHKMILMSAFIIMVLNSGVNFLFHTTACIIAIVYLAIIEKENELCQVQKKMQFQCLMKKSTN